MVSTRSIVWSQPETIRKLGIELYHEMTEGGAVYLEVIRGPFRLNFRVPELLLTALTKLRG